MLNPYTTIAMFNTPHEPDAAAKFREQYFTAATEGAAQKREPDYIRKDPLLLARLWIQIGRFGRVA